MLFPLCLLDLLRHCSALQSVSLRLERLIDISFRLRASIERASSSFTHLQKLGPGSLCGHA